MRKEFKLNTPKEAMIAITREVASFVDSTGVEEGVVVVYSPHTTAGITINENSDPDVQHDLLLAMGEIFHDDKRFRHMEGNSAAHLKTTMVGSSATVIITKGRLDLGVWQDIYFCEFDGPRSRRFICKIVSG
ncbi:MAG: YjbQ family protein [Spirochaetales bacterium]|jgi:secondary thiamine-phosphate synthase enzyme|nr:YjbQ family protein [Spirochaetales bacterium]